MQVPLSIRADEKLQSLLSYRIQNPMTRFLVNFAFLLTSAIVTMSYWAPQLTNMAGEFDIGKVMIVAITVIVTFIMALIASLIGVSLISPVATAVGGALKNGNLTGAANSVTAQITLIFVTLVIIGILVFLALFGFLASAAAHDG
jgi:fatty acid desaturase